MTYRELEVEIREKSETEACKKKITQRREEMMALSQAVARIKERDCWEPKQRQACPKATFTINMKQLKQGGRKDSFRINVEVASKNIGTIHITGNESPIFEPEGDSHGLKWSKNNDDAKAIRQILENAAKVQDGEAIQEREIQWQMVAALDEGSTHDALSNLRPVLMAGYPSEIPTWVKRTGEIGTGNIDALVRRHRGGNAGAQYLVFELKRPKGDGPEKALHQAIRYAAALYIEANGCVERQTSYRALFGLPSSGELKFGAVAVVEGNEKNRELAEKAIEDLQHPGRTNNILVDRIAVLFYDWDKEKHRATNWRWLPGTDPR